MNHELKPLMVTKEVGAVLGVNDSRVRQIILSEKLKAEKMDLDWVIRRRDL